MMLFWSAISFTEGCVVLFLLNGFYLMKAAILISHFIYSRLRGSFIYWMVFIYRKVAILINHFMYWRAAWFFYLLNVFSLFTEGCYFDQPFYLLKAVEGCVVLFFITEGLLFTEGCYFYWCEYGKYQHGCMLYELQG